MAITEHKITDLTLEFLYNEVQVNGRAGRLMGYSLEGDRKHLMFADGGGPLSWVLVTEEDTVYVLDAPTNSVPRPTVHFAS
jgi:hypothetical protein